MFSRLRHKGVSLLIAFGLNLLNFSFACQGQYSSIVHIYLFPVSLCIGDNIFGGEITKKY